MAGDEPTATAERVRLVLASMPDRVDRLAQALGVEDLEARLQAGDDWNLSELAVAADVLDVPVRALSGAIPLTSDLSVSLRLGQTPVEDAPSAALQRAALMLQRSALLDGWLGKVEQPQRNLPVSIDRFHKEAGLVTARRVRALLGFDRTAPVPDLVGLVEAFGFAVSFCPLPDGVHGLNVRQETDGHVRRVILISTGDGWARQRFTLAHELSHGIFDDDGQVIIDRVEVPDTLPEIRAEAFARHLLLPIPALKAALAELRGSSDGVVTAKLMVRFGLSKPAVVKALVDDRHFTPERADRIKEVPVRDLMIAADLLSEWLTLSAAEHEESGSPLLLSRALEAYANGWIDRGIVAELVGMPESEIAQTLAERGWDPVPSD